MMDRRYLLLIQINTNKLSRSNFPNFATKVANQGLKEMLLPKKCSITRVRGRWRILMAYKAKLPLTTQTEIQNARQAKTESIQIQSLTQWIQPTNDLRIWWLPHVEHISRPILSARRVSLPYHKFWEKRKRKSQGKSLKNRAANSQKNKASYGAVKQVVSKL